MTESPATYPNYRASGSSWIGHVPTHWEVRRIKADVSDVADLTNHRKPNESYVALEHVESWTGRIIEPESYATFENQAKRFRPGDVLFGKLRPYLAKVTQPEQAGVCVGEFLVLRPHEDVMAPSYLERLMRSKPMIDLVDASTFGAKMPRANWNFIGNVAIPVPPSEEQAAIVRFLDHVDEQIQRYIDGKERLIALLEEERQALVHQAVTRGLDPNVRLKPSGVEWLGDIPKHWETLRVGHFSDVGNGSTPARGNATYWTGGVHPWLNSSSVNQGTITKADQFVTESALSECHLPRLHPGSLLVGITGQGKTRGMSAVLGIEATINQHMAFIALKTPRVSSRYLHLYLTAAYTELRTISLSSGSTRAALTCEDIKRFMVALPPRDEQERLLSEVGRKLASVDDAIARTRRQIDLMNEYRTRLIADVVTGKIDVLEAAENLLQPHHEDTSP